MVVQEIIAAIEDRHIIMNFDITDTLGNFRKYLIDQKFILVEADGDTWRFAKVENNKISETAHVDNEKYIPVSAYIYDTNTIQVANLKKSLEVFADTLHEFFRVDVSDNLSDLRTLLIEKTFIDADTDTSAWRFLSPNAKDLKDISEAIIGIESEHAIVVKNFLYGSKKVRMVNITRKKSPDLIGVGADSFTNGDIVLRILRNDSFDKTKLAPILMTDVRSVAKHGPTLDFDMVVLCEKQTAIAIRIETKTHGGFAYSIKVRDGDDIVSSFQTYWSGWTTYAYQGTSNAIVVVSHKDLGIPTQQSIGHRRIMVKVWRYISYKTDGIKHIVDDRAPKVEHRSIRSSGVDPIPGESIESGAFKEGGHTANYIGGGSISDIVVNPDEVLGYFEVDFFVFKTAQNAQDMVESRISPFYC